MSTLLHVRLPMEIFSDSSLEQPCAASAASASRVRRRDSNANKVDGRRVSIKELVRRPCKCSAGDCFQQYAGKVSDVEECRSELEALELPMRDIHIELLFNLRERVPIDGAQSLNDEKRSKTPQMSFRTLHATQLYPYKLQVWIRLLKILLKIRTKTWNLLPQHKPASPSLPGLDYQQPENTKFGKDLGARRMFFLDLQFVSGLFKSCTALGTRRFRFFEEGAAHDDQATGWSRNTRSSVFLCCRRATSFGHLFWASFGCCITLQQKDCRKGL